MFIQITVRASVILTIILYVRTIPSLVKAVNEAVNRSSSIRLKQIVTAKAIRKRTAPSLAARKIVPIRRKILNGFEPRLPISTIPRESQRPVLYAFQRDRGT